MKKNVMRVINANFVSKFFKTTIVVLSLTAATGAYAANLPEVLRSGEPANAVVTYVAADSESMFFDVNVKNSRGEKFVIVVKDESGNTLYRAAYTDKDFKKRFMLPKTGASKITFYVKSEGGSKAESFEINTNTRVVEEVSVKKVA